MRYPLLCALALVGCTSSKDTTPTPGTRDTVKLPPVTIPGDTVRGPPFVRRDTVAGEPFVRRDTVQGPTVQLPPDTLPGRVVQLPPDTTKGAPVVRIDTTVVGRVDTVTVPGGTVTIRDTVIYAPTVSAALDVVTFSLFPFVGHRAPPTPFRVPLAPGTVRVDTITIRSRDTVWYLPPNPGGVQSDTSLHIADMPSRVGEMNVYWSERYLGRLGWTGNIGSKTWYAYQYWPGMMQMPRLAGSFPDSLSAMQALARATYYTTPPNMPSTSGLPPGPAPANTPPSTPPTAELPRVMLDTRMPNVPIRKDP